ncbi:MAG: hypothetical protein ACFUZC_21660 [Chthoniobacteraceae bacterium]
MRLPLRRILPIAAVLAVWVTIAGVWFGGFPSWMRYWERSVAGSGFYKFGREKPFGDGKVVLDKIWFDEGKPETIWVTGRFIGSNPSGKMFLKSRIREASDGPDNDLTNFCMFPSTKNGRVEVGFRLEFRNAPVAAQVLYIRIYGEPKGAQNAPLCALAEFAFPNPHPRRIEHWEAEPIPATRKIDPLTVELVDLRCGSSDAPKGSGTRGSGTRLFLRVLENGGLTKRWRPMGIVYSSGLGVSHFSRGSFFTPYGTGVTILYDTFWQCLAPWKIHVTLMQTKDFRPEEILEIPDIPIPSDWQSIPFGRKWRVAGQEVQFVRVSKGEENAPRWRAPKSIVYLHFTTPDPQSCWLKLLSVADAQGKVIWEPRAEYWHGSFESQNASFALPEGLPLEGKISCKFGVVWEKREVEFVVTPTF